MSKIVLVSTSLKMGGVEQASVNLANGLKNIGHDVTFISLFNQTKFFNLNDGIKFIEPDDFNIDRLSIIKSILWLRKIIISENPSAVVVFQKFYSALVLVALSGTFKRIFISERSSPKFKWPLHVRIFSNIVFLFLKPAGIIAQTKIAEEYQKKYYGKKVPVKVIPNVVRDVKLYPDIQRKNVILAVGRFGDYQKGFDRLIMAFALIKNKWELHFAGGCDEDGNLKNMARELGVSERVRFLGKVKDMDRVYAEAGIFVITSRSEGFPNALCEAMAAGLPCISFDFIAGPREIITSGQNGILVENGNISALAKAIDHLIENPSERARLGQSALKIRDRLNIEKIGRLYSDFILEKNG